MRLHGLSPLPRQRNQLTHTWETRRCHSSGAVLRSPMSNRGELCQEPPGRPKGKRESEQAELLNTASRGAAPGRQEREGCWRAGTEPHAARCSGIIAGLGLNASPPYSENKTQGHFRYVSPRTEIAQQSPAREGNIILPTGYRSLPSPRGPAPQARNRILCRTPAQTRAHALPAAAEAGGGTVPAFPGAGGGDGAGGREALRGTGLCRELLGASRWSYSKRQQTGNPIWQPQQAPVGLGRWFWGGVNQPTQLPAEKWGQPLPCPGCCSNPGPSHTS